ncbi:MAG: thiamine pyrophosphate-binding protein [Desulfotomaculales bacterium]
MTGKKMNGGALAAEVLRKEGVRYLFGLAGGHIYPLIEACAQKGIRYIGTRHEMNAAFLAEGWALATGETGVCTATAGPGFTNLLTGLANADRGGHPVLCLAGKARITENDRNELQDFNQMDMIKHMTRHARTVAEAHRIPEYVGRALAHCRTGRPGPVYLEIPRDVLEKEVDPEKAEFQKTYCTSSRPAGDERDVAAAARAIAEAKRPVLIAGGGVWWARAEKELKDFVEKSGIPLFTRNAARGAVSDDHPLFLGVAATKHPLFRAALAEADLAVIAGTRTGYTMSRDFFPRTLKIVRIDIDPAELTNQLDVEVGIAGDARLVLAQLTGAVRPAGYPEWVGRLKEMKENIALMTAAFGASDQTPIHPLRLVAEVSKRVDAGTVVVIDGGDAAIWGNLALPAKGPGQFLNIAGTSFGPLGVGIPYALAAKLAHPEKQVILITGDGAFGYGAMEYDTAVRYGIPFTAVILNDRCWGMIKRGEATRSSPDWDFVGLELGGARYDLIAEAMGGHGEYVTRPEEIGPALERALASGKPACVNVLTDPGIGPGI